MVYVSMTGFRPRGIVQLPRFWWRTAQSLAQARRAAGVVAVEAKVVGGTYHTLTAWSDLVSMRSFVASGAPQGDEEHPQPRDWQDFRLCSRSASGVGHCV